MIHPSNTSGSHSQTGLGISIWKIIWNIWSFDVRDSDFYVHIIGYSDTRAIFFKVRLAAIGKLRRKYARSGRRRLAQCFAVIFILQPIGP